MLYYIVARSALPASGAMTRELKISQGLLIIPCTLTVALADDLGYGRVNLLLADDAQLFEGWTLQQSLQKSKLRATQSF